MGQICCMICPDSGFNDGIDIRGRRAANRNAAVEELINTEETYVNNLNICITKYYVRFSTETKIINNDDVKKIFNHLQTILGINSVFLKDLQSDTTRIGHRFIEFCPYFRMYQNYCNQYDEAMFLLNKYNKKDSFHNLCTQIRDENDGKTLQSLLILPIQRLPRYKLCLNEIIKNTEEKHNDLQDLNQALQLVEETTALINDRMKEFDARQNVRAIESRFTSSVNLLKPHRKFIFESLLTKVNKTGKDKVYTFILFNDILIYAENKGNKSNNASLKMHGNLPIDEAFYITDIATHNEYKDCAFEIHSSVKSFIVHCEQNSVKKKWLNHLSNVIKEKQRLKRDETTMEDAAPLMIRDDESEICMMKDCDTEFTFMNRRHHCRFCGRLMCAKCGKYNLAQKMDKERTVKVCKECFAKYENIYPAKANAKEVDALTPLLSGK